MARYIAGVLFLLAAATLTPTFVAPAMAPRQISGGLPTARSDASADAMGGGRSATGSLVCVAGLLVFAQRQLRSSRSAEGKINSKITPEVPKVVTKEDLKAGDKKVYCRCWLSGTFPLCDGSHAKHNEETGDNVGPLIVGVKKGD